MINGLALYSGGGGLELGLHLVFDGLYRTVCAVERQAYPAACLVEWMEKAGLGACPVWDDVTTFDPLPWRECVDIVSAGYPCQPYSLAGRQLGENDPRHGWPHVRRTLRGIMPAVFFGENVAAHLANGFAAVKADLEAMGYRVEAGIYSAAEVGASHLRERLFILGVLADAYGGFGPWRSRIERGSAAGRATVGRAGEAVASARSLPSFAGAERPGQEARTDADWSGTRAELGNASSSRLQVGGCRQVGRLTTIKEPQRLCGSFGSLVSPNELRLESRRGQVRTTNDAPAIWPWPAGRGAEQYPWEEPRLVKSGMGGTTHGVGARNEQLYMLGNGVVPVAAAMAFVALWEKIMRGA